MSIPTQLPHVVTAAKHNSLLALALVPGQVLEGTILGPAPGGGTQVDIAGQKLNLLLPTLLAVGASIKLEVLATGPQLRLVLQTPASSKGAVTATPSPAPVSIAPLPATLPFVTPVALKLEGPVTAKRPAIALPLAQAVLPAVSEAIGPIASVAPTHQTATALPQPPPSAAVPSSSQGNTQHPSAPVAPATPVAQTNVTEPAARPSTSSASVATPVTISVLVVPATPLQQPGILRTSQAPQNVQLLPTTTVASASPSVGNEPASATPVPEGDALRATSIPAPQGSQKSASIPRSATQLYPSSSPTLLGTPLPTAVQPSGTTQAAPVASMTTPVSAVLPGTPEAALTQMIQAALPRQNSVANLTMALAAVADKVALPEPVIRAARLILTSQLHLDVAKFDGATLQKVVLSSGIFQEAGLISETPSPATDMKSALLALRTTLTDWLGPQAALQPIRQIAPPLRGVMPRAPRTASTPIDPAAEPIDVGKHLLDHTEAAVSRLRLHQAASLPDPATPGRADWSMDLPIVVAGHQTILQLQIHREQQGSAATPGERGWQMRFALNIPALGEVGAQVSLRGATTGVMLWASDPETSQALDAEAPHLRKALTALGLQVGAVIVRHGEPLATAPASSGHLLDATR